VIQLGEKKKYIYVVGALGSEMLSDLNYLSKKKIENKLKMKFNKFNFLITINSYFYENVSIYKFMKSIFQAILKYNNTNYIFTLPNSDLNSDLIANQIYKFNKKNKNSYIFKNLGFNYYNSVMKYCDVVIGNSSSGIIEAPSLKIPTVNIGLRQKGRLKPDTIINAKPNSSNIFNAIKKSLSRSFKNKIAKSKNLYYKKNTSNKIFDIIKNINLKKIDKKEFQDIKFL
jgi:GDP/UDP-N,N'-diacetylbacillosamine 2-epimerase (hydrolysing)